MKTKTAIPTNRQFQPAWLSALALLTILASGPHSFAQSASQPPSASQAQTPSAQSTTTSPAPAETPKTAPPETAPAVQLSAPSADKSAAASTVPAATPESAKPTPAATAPAAPHSQLADDTARLYTLANELKVEMDKSGKDTLSLAVVKKADEIEKLARKVRAEMKASIGN
jgi:hypothetical protein